MSANAKRATRGGEPSARTAAKLVRSPAPVTTASAADSAREAEPEAPRRRRADRRSIATVRKILTATEQLVLASDDGRFSILEVCHAADISRGTFYRYFSSQEELLDAFSRHKRESFHRSLREATAPHQDPDARLQAVIDYLDGYLNHSQVRRLLRVAPDFALGFFNRIFHDSIVRFQDVLGIVFDSWEEQYGLTVDRELIAELLIRYVLSEQLVRGGPERRLIPVRIAKMALGLHRP